MAGTGFGKYELVSRLAKGGMAETFRARLTGEAGVTKEVVIKKMLASLAEDEGFVAAFISEARLSARFNHPNIAQIFDFGEEAGQYFLAMELVDGKSLADVLARAAAKGMQKLPEPIACFIAMEVLKALHYAHTRNDDDGKPLQIVHRDISPDNVLVSFEGDIKVVDFGIAKAALRGRRETQAGLVKGKYLYFSPEQAEAEALDGRSDVFAVGILLYRMLCGVLPFEGQLHVAVAKILTGDYRPPFVLSPNLSPPLAAIIVQALARKRDDRFESALRMQEALSAELFRVEQSFSSETLKEFIGWLFETEQVKAGAPSGGQKRLKAMLAKSAKQLEPVGSAALPAPPPKGVPMALKILVAIASGVVGIAVAEWSIDEAPAPAHRPMLSSGPTAIAALVPGPAPARAPPGAELPVAQPLLVRRVYELPALVQLDREHRIRFDPQFIFNVAGAHEIKIDRKLQARVGATLMLLVSAIGVREAGPQYVPVPLGERLRFDGPTRLMLAAPVIDGFPSWQPVLPDPSLKRPIVPPVRRVEEHEGLWAAGLKRENSYRVELTSKQKGLLTLAVGKPELRLGMKEVLILVDGTWKPSAQLWPVPSRHDVSGVTTLWFGILSISSDPELTLSIVDLGPRAGADKDPVLSFPPDYKSAASYPGHSDLLFKRPRVR